MILVKKSLQILSFEGMWVLREYLVHILQEQKEQ